jgi:hypothetical protein
MKESMLQCECGNDVFKVKMIKDQAMQDTLDYCDTYAAYCTNCGKGKAVRYLSKTQQRLPKI